MKKSEDNKPSPVAVRYMEFVADNEGPSAVAKKMGKHPQFIYNIRDGKAKPSYDTLLETWQAFRTRFDLMYVMTGVRSAAGASESESEPDKPDSDSDKIESFQRVVTKQQAIIDKLEAKIDRLEAQNSQLLTAVLERMHPHLLTDKEGVKIGSDHHSTDRLLPPDTLRQIGFHAQA